MVEDYLGLDNFCNLLKINNLIMKKLLSLLLLFIPLLSFSNYEKKLKSDIVIHKSFVDSQDCIGATAYRYEPNGRVAESVSIKICHFNKTINQVYFAGRSVSFYSEGQGKYRISTNKGNYYFSF